MKNKMKLKFFLILLAATTAGCLKSKKTEFPSGKSAKEQLSDAASRLKEVVIPPVPQSQPVEGSTLEILNLNLEAVHTDEYRSLKITVKSSPGTDHMEYSICPRDHEYACNPTRDSPGVMTSLVYTYHTPPKGNIVVAVRACVRPKNAVSTQRLCGEWEERPYVQKDNEGVAVEPLMEQLQANEDEMRRVIGAFFLNLKDFFDRQSPGRNVSHEYQQLNNMMYNTLQLGEDRFFELVKAGILDYVEQDYALQQLKSDAGLQLTEQEEPDYSVQPEKEKRKDQTANATVLLGLGSLFIAGGGYQTYQAIKRLDTTLDAIDKIKNEYEAKRVSVAGDGVDLEKMASLQYQSKKIATAKSEIVELKNNIKQSGSPEALWKNVAIDDVDSKKIKQALTEDVKFQNLIADVSTNTKSEFTTRQITDLKASLSALELEGKIPKGQSDKILLSIRSGLAEVRKDSGLLALYTDLEKRKISALGLLDTYEKQISLDKKSKLLEDLKNKRVEFDTGKVSVEDLVGLQQKNHPAIFDAVTEQQITKKFTDSSLKKDLMTEKIESVRKAVINTEGVDTKTVMETETKKVSATVDDIAGKKGVGVVSGFGAMAFGIILTVLGTGVLSNSGSSGEQTSASLAEGTGGGNSGIVGSLSDVREGIKKIDEHRKRLEDAIQDAGENNQ